MSQGIKRPHPSSYRQRSYRQPLASDKCSFEVRIEESDLWISGIKSDLEPLAYDRLLHYRKLLSAFLQRHPDWRESLAPVVAVDYPLAPPLARQMMTASEIAGVGPMAAVAGAIAEAVGRDLIALSTELVVENGGDIFLAGRSEYSLAVRWL